MAHIELSHVDHALDDGRPLLRDVNLRVGDGREVALVGPNGIGKTTLLRLLAGRRAAPGRRPRRRPARLGVMRQFIGSVRDESTVRDLLLTTAPPRPCRRRRRVEAAELAMMDTDDEPAADALRAGARRLGRRRRLRRRGPLGHRAPSRRCASPTTGASTASCRRSPAASRSGSRSRRCCAAPTRCCCSTSRTTTSTSPASGGWRQRLRETPQDGALRQPRPGAARPLPPTAIVDPGAERRRRDRLGARRRVRDLPRGARRPERAAGRAAPPLGRGARSGSRTSCGCASSRRRTTPDMASPLPRPRRPGWRSSRRPARRRPAAGAEGRRCGCAAAAPASARSPASGWS